MKYKNISLFTTFLRIGAFTLGGGYAMIPLVQREVVDHQHWIEEEEFLDLIALAQSAPGIIAVNTAVFVGYKINGWTGLLSSVIGAILPSFLIILGIATCFTRFRDNEAIEAIFKGIRPAVVALIAAPLYKMGKSAKITWKTLIIPMVAALLIWRAKVSPVLIIIIALATGVAVVWWKEKREEKKIRERGERGERGEIGEIGEIGEREGKEEVEEVEEVKEIEEREDSKEKELEEGKERRSES